jgi:hypothetical protein
VRERERERERESHLCSAVSRLRGWASTGTLTGDSKRPTISVMGGYGRNARIWL